MPVVDLFCGCGGLSKGFEQAGFDIVAAYDAWNDAILCYNANFAHHAAVLNLSEVDHAVETIAQNDPEIIIGGPPCQDFSNAGLREEGERANLTYYYAQIVTRILPQYFVMENVPRARNSDAYGRARALYKEHNYGLTEITIDASMCGVPQKRNRFFCIGAQNAPDGFLLDALFNHMKDEPTSIQEYFDLHNIPLNIERYYRHPTTYSRKAVFSVDEPSPTIRGVNRPKPENYRRHPRDSVTDQDLPMVRPLTTRQRAAIQSFPDDYHFEDIGISRGSLEQMIGNAVPVQLAQFVAERLDEYIIEEPHQMLEVDSFSAWLRNEKEYTSDRSISDVFSRLRRAERILPNRKMDNYYITDLEGCPEFTRLETTVKSQIRKAIRLRIAYEEYAKENGRL